MQHEPELEAEEPGFPVIPYPSSTVYVKTGQSDTYTCHQASIQASESRTVTSIHYINGSAIFIQMSNIAPQQDTAAVIRTTKDPVNIVIESMTMKIVYQSPVPLIDGRPNINVATSVTMLTTAALPSSGKAVQDYFASLAPTSIQYTIPRLCLVKYKPGPFTGFTESSPVEEDVPFRFTTIGECSQALSRNTYTKMCTAMIYPPSCRSKQEPANEIVLIPEPVLSIPVEFSVGFDNVRLFHEYISLRNQSKGADTTILVPLFRSKDTVFVPTLFGFWLRYFMDVHNGRRMHVLPKKAWVYAPSIESCKMLPDDGSASLNTIMIEAPKSLLATMYDSLLSALADNASARLYHTQKTNLAFIFRGSLMMDHSIVELTTKYRQVTVTNKELQKQEPFETSVDVIHRAVDGSGWW